VRRSGSAKLYGTPRHHVFGSCPQQKLTASSGHPWQLGRNAGSSRTHERPKQRPMNNHCVDTLYLTRTENSARTTSLVTAARTKTPQQCARASTAGLLMDGFMDDGAIGVRVALETHASEHKRACMVSERRRTVGLLECSRIANATCHGRPALTLQVTYQSK